MCVCACCRHGLTLQSKEKPSSDDDQLVVVTFDSRTSLVESDLLDRSAPLPSAVTTRKLVFRESVNVLAAGGRVSESFAYIRLRASTFLSSLW